MYVQRPNEIPFRIGTVRAFVNPPMPAGTRIDSEQFVYRADQAIRINREALFEHYNMVLRDVVRLSGLQRDEVHETLQEVLDKIRA
jgi:hypothetical protein